MILMEEVSLVKIALIGYGKMGQMIEKIALERGHCIVAKISSGQWPVDALLEADICMEFTHPGCVLENVRRIAELQKNVVIGTTGWEDKIDVMHSILEEKKIGALYSPNFSIGVNLFIEILSYASKVISGFAEYDVAGFEIHHHTKKDNPSGTALEIAKAIEKNMQRIDKVPFSSIRCGLVPGTHKVLFDSFCDTLSMTHETRNREGFAQGALLAAEWLRGKKGIYTFADCMKEILKQRSS